MAVFQGFPKECVQFFAELSRHNRKDWFERHRQDYERFVLEPSRAFIVELGDCLRTITPNVIADPRTNQSLFRINRDTRFCREKTPYKTHLGLWLWEGVRPRMECSGYYFQLDPEGVMLAAGLYQFPPTHLAEYRRSVADAKLGAGLQRVILKVESVRGNRVEGEQYKRIPRGFSPDHPRADLLRYQGLFGSRSLGFPAKLGTAGFLDLAFEVFRSQEPLHRWLADMVGRLERGAALPQR